MLLISQLNLTKNLKKIISCTPQGREKVEDYTVVFLDCICNQCNFTKKVTDGRYLFIFQKIKGEIDWSQR